MKCNVCQNELLHKRDAWNCPTPETCGFSCSRKCHEAHMSNRDNDAAHNAPTA